MAFELDPNKPIFSNVFTKQWDELPSAMKRHYSVRPFSDDVVKVEGRLDIEISFFVSIMSRVTGMLLDVSGKNVPVTVTFRSDKAGAFCFERIFHFPDKRDKIFRSRMEWIKDNEMVEFMRFGIGWHLAYSWDGTKIMLSHKGYVWRVLGVMIPLPLSLVMGKGYAEEVPISEDSFSMWTHAKHSLFGKTFAYSGEFKITEESCRES